MSEVVATAYDTVGNKVDKIPADAKVVLGYMDGKESAWNNDQWAQFGNIIRGAITVTGGDNWKYASIFDCEKEDITPDHLPALIKARNKFTGRNDATIYCNLSTLPAAVLASDTCAEPYWIWIADPIGKPRGGYSLHTGNGRICAQQYDWQRDYDISAIYSQEWLDTLVQPPKPKPDAANLGGYVVYQSAIGSFSGRPVKSVDNGKHWE